MPRLNTDVNILFYPTIAAACSAFFFLILFLVLWVIFSTTTSSFTVTSVIVSKFNIITTHSTKSELTATFNVEGILQNHNIAYSIRYESLDLVLWFDNFTIASAPIRQPPFSTQAQTITPVQAQFAMARRPLPSGLASEITAERNYHGSVDFGATLVAGFRYKFGVLHSKVRHFKLDCHPLHVALHANETIGKLVAPVDCKIV
ncbi:hypothetical protein AAZX31_10G075700 [Glycine max]|nr:hypothetical protein GLYMA_10G080301v4 [Glycine max]KAH1137294.1 hypothetical protein GYH30_027329 [Glycine max]